MVKKEEYIGLGIDQDTAPDKRKTDTFWDSENIVIVNNGRSLSIKPIKGETEVVNFPLRDTYQSYIVGYNSYKSDLFVFTVDEGGRCSIQKIDSSYNITVLDYGDFNWNKDTTRVDSIINYENDNLIKLYFIDGINPLKFINISSTAISSAINSIVDEITLSQSTVSMESGGELIAGNIQYLYNGYNFYGSQSVLSPASSMISISKYYLGFPSNTNTGLRGVVTIDTTGLTNYQALKVYSIHYLELDQTPVIKLIYDEYLNTERASITIYDNGVTSIATLGLQDLLNISPLPYIPNTLAIKRERLFLGNYTLNNFNPDVDMRAYSFTANSTTLTVKHNGTNQTYASYGSVPSTSDAINPDYNTYSYQYNSTTKGGTGLNINYSFATSAIVNNVVPPKSLKRFEIYRVGVILYNKYGQKSPVKWMADFRVPSSLSIDVVTGLGVQLTSTGVTNLTNAGVVSYQLCIVERKPEDRTILSQGFIVPAALYTLNGLASNKSPYYYPYYISKDVVSADIVSNGADLSQAYVNDVDWSWSNTPADTHPYPLQKNDVCFFYSTDTIFETSPQLPTKVRIIGEAIKTTTDGNTDIWQHRDDIAVLYASLTGTEPYWGDLGFGNPFHVMDQSTTPEGGANVNVYSIAFNKVYTDLYRKAYSETVDVVTLDTGYPASLYFNSGETKLLQPGITVANSAQLTNLIDIDTSKIPTSYFSTFSPSIALNFITNTWHQESGRDFGAFDGGTVYYDSHKRGLPLVEILRDVTNQYGGSSYESKQRNEYLPLGNIRAVNTTGNTEYIGDVWVGTLSINRTDGLDNKTHGQMGIYEHIHVPYIENNHNVYARSDSEHNYSYGGFFGQDMRLLRIADNHKLLKAYDQVANVFKVYPEPFTFQDVNRFPITVIGSDPKTAGELIDNWLNFNPSNYKLMEGQYGEIAKLHNLGGELLCVQATGIALLEIEPRIQTLDTEGIGIQLGIGNLFYNHKYISTNSGATSKWVVCEDGKDLYYYDSTLNIIFSLHGGKLSTIKTVKAILDAYPNGPHTATFSNAKAHIYFQFNEFTLVYDLLLEKFISKHYYLNSNKWLIVNGNDLYQIDDSGETTTLYTQLTGVTKDSSITYLLCPEGTYEKTFHNLEYRLKDNNFTEVLVTNDRSSSGTVSPDVKTKFDIHRIHLPRVQNSRERWRGIYIFVKLSNTDDYSLDNLVLMYNIKG